MHTERTQKFLREGVWGWNPPPVRPDAEAPVVALVRISGRGATGRTSSVAYLGVENGPSAPINRIRRLHPFAGLGGTRRRRGRLTLYKGEQRDEGGHHA